MTRTLLPIIAALVMLIFAAPRRAEAQEPSPCAADAVLKEALERDPEIRRKRQALERRVEAYKRNAAQSPSAAKTSEGAPGRAKYYIPCVVHVIHDGNPATPDRISAEQIESQFVALNNDYRRVPGTVGYGAGADMEIEFSLVTRAPDGSPTNGIIYHEDPDLAVLQRNAQDDLALKSQYGWPNDRYANIFLVQSIEGATGEQSVLGYAQFPYSFEATEGVVIRSNCFGTTGEIGGPNGQNVLGRTAAHEFGHFFNLFHTFQDDCDTDSCHKSGDRVCDTPPADDPTFGLGFLRQNTCYQTERDLAEDRPDNPRNYMDYLSDYGMNFFTPEQKLRVHAVLEDRGNPYRYDLWQDANLRDVGAGPYRAPHSDFNANTRITCPGQTVTFYDYSTGGSETYRWEFEGGTPSTSNARFPQVAWNEPGVYGVILTVTNASGESDQAFKEGFIFVDDNVLRSNYSEDFGSANFPYAGTAVFNYDAANEVVSETWERDRGGYLRLNCGDYSDYGQFDDFYLPAFDFSESEAALVAFDYIYAPYEWGETEASALLYSDTLSIQYSTDCGATWQTVFRRGGLELSSVDRSAPFVINDANEEFWRRAQAVCLTGAGGNANVRVRFRMKNGFGNNFFLDNLFLEPTSQSFCSTVGRPGSELAPEPQAWPNPANETLFIRWSEQPLARRAIIEVYDISGAQVAASVLPPFSEPETSIDLSGVSPGVYVARIYAGGAIKTVKFIRQ